MLGLPFDERAEMVEVAVQELPASRQRPSASQVFIHLMPEVCVIPLLAAFYAPLAPSLNPPGR